MKPGILATVLSLVVALVFAVGYMSSGKPWQLMLAVMCLIVSVVMYMRNKRLKAGH
jgi:hypothetical protein